MNHFLRKTCICFFLFITPVLFGDNSEVVNEEIEAYIKNYGIPLGLRREDLAWDYYLEHIVGQIVFDKAYTAKIELRNLGIEENCAQNLIPDLWLYRNAGAGYAASRMIEGANESSMVATVDMVATKLHVICAMHFYDVEKFLKLVLNSNFPKDIKDDARQLLEGLYDSSRRISYSYKERYELAVREENKNKLVRITACAIHAWAKDYVAELVVPVLRIGTGVSGKYEFLDNGSHVAENSLAWVVERDLNIAPIFEGFKVWFIKLISDEGKICLNTSVLTQQEFADGKYIPLEAHLALLKHLAIQLAGAKKLIYYNSDSLIYGLDRKSDASSLYNKRQVNNYEIGFDNDGILMALIAVAARWDKESNQWDGIEYDWYSHNCKHYINSVGGVIDQYVQYGYKVYLKHKCGSVNDN